METIIFQVPAVKLQRGVSMAMVRFFGGKIHHHSLGRLGQSFAEASPKPEVSSDIKHRVGFWVQVVPSRELTYPPKMAF